MRLDKVFKGLLFAGLVAGAGTLGTVQSASAYGHGISGCEVFGKNIHGRLTRALKASVAPTASVPNGGLDLNMWGSIVARNGKVCAVARTGATPGDQWPGSRVISAQKANAANSFSLPDLALSTANLWAATQPGGSLFGLQFSNPVDPTVAYRGNANRYGTRFDPLVGKRVGGVNVFGGGLALYNGDGVLLGAVGVSGDTSCADHNIAWRVRDKLRLDHVPAGVGTPGDNIIFDVNPPAGDGPSTVSVSGFGHPKCAGGGDVDDNGNPDDGEDNNAVVAEAPLGDN